MFKDPCLQHLHPVTYFIHFVYHSLVIPYSVLSNLQMYSDLFILITVYHTSSMFLFRFLIWNYTWPLHKLIIDSLHLIAWLPIADDISWLVSVVIIIVNVLLGPRVNVSSRIYAFEDSLKVLCLPTRWNPLLLVIHYSYLFNYFKSITLCEQINISNAKVFAISSCG